MTNEKAQGFAKREVREFISGGFPSITNLGAELADISGGFPVNTIK